MVRNGAVMHLLKLLQYLLACAIRAPVPRLNNVVFMQTIMLLLGGFAIASAFTKHFIAKRLATWVLSKVNTQ